ncbi:hypothetical protein, partial [Acinetobacter baumannii]|uniref:hypothetical protein n=1 Tax=Acinetobacter baumannii TaxID=470 RepID=UPI003392D044
SCFLVYVWRDFSASYVAVHTSMSSSQLTKAVLGSDPVKLARTALPKLSLGKMFTTLAHSAD